MLDPSELTYQSCHPCLGLWKAHQNKVETGLGHGLHPVQGMDFAQKAAILCDVLRAHKLLQNGFHLKGTVQGRGRDGLLVHRKPLVCCLWGLLEQPLAVISLLWIKKALWFVFGWNRTQIYVPHLTCSQEVRKHFLLCISSVSSGRVRSNTVGTDLCSS